MKKIAILFLSIILVQSVSLVIFFRTWNAEAQDFFAFYSAARLGMTGQNPYDIEGLREEERLNHDRSGRSRESDFAIMFNPPEALVLFAPFSMLPWKSACWAWLSAQMSLALGLACLAWTFGGGGRPRWLGLALALIFLLNPLTYRLLALGQCTLIVASTIALGQWAYEARRPIIGATLWSVAGIKPHFAIPFLALAYILGGWRRLAGVVLVIGVSNVSGCLITTGTLRTLLDYARFVAGNHLIGLNRVEQDQVTSWNRVLYVLGGPAWNLSAAGMIASHAAWLLLIWIRIGRPAPAGWMPSYALAVAAVGSVFCAVSHGYDLVMLSLLAPLIIARYDLGQRWEAALIAGLLILTCVPRNVVEMGIEVFGLWPNLRQLVLSYRSLVLACLAAYLGFRGQGGLLKR